MCFEYQQLLYPPISRAAYSDRMAWLMAEMSRIAYITFEDSDNNLNELRGDLQKANFELVRTFNKGDTQAFLAKREKDGIAVLSFRGTQVNKWGDIWTDLNFPFYRDTDGTKIHTGFKKAFSVVEQDILNGMDNLKKEDFSLYITGHSLGGALALMAAYSLSSDSIAACYTFGSPRVGNIEFADDIKVPIYRVVNANDIVPRLPFPLAVELFYWMSYFKSLNFLRLIFSEKGIYAHEGDMRYLTQDINNLKLIANPGLLDAPYRYLNFWNIKLGIKNHSCDDYCAKLAKHALERLGIK